MKKILSISLFALLLGVILMTGCAKKNNPLAPNLSGTTAPTVISTLPADGALGVAVNANITATFSKAMDATTISTATFTLKHGTNRIAGVVSYSGSVATFHPATNLTASFVYTATIKAGVKDSAGNALAANKTWIFTTGTVVAQGPARVNLASSSNFVILSKAGITTASPSTITGNIGVSPITYASITGFALTPIVPDAFTTYATSLQVSGKVYAADYVSNTPAMMTAAIGDMMAAYGDAAGRTTPDFTDLGAGSIGGLTLVPGLYKWTTGLNIPTDVTLNGGPNAVWIFQVSGAITEATGIHVNLTGGANPQNIFWQVNTTVTLGTGALFQGIILSGTDVTLGTGASVKGGIYSKNSVILDANIVKPTSP